MTSTRHPTAQRLLEAAIAAIDSGGESALRLDEIVEEAGVAITAVYHHFGNREGLMEAAQIERYFRAVWPGIHGMEMLLEGVNDAVTLRRVLTAALDEAISSRFTVNRLRRVNAVGSSLGRPHLAAAIIDEQERATRHMADALRPFQASGMIRKDVDLDVFAQWVQGLILSRVMVELGGDTQAGGSWDAMTRQVAMHLLFEPEEPSTSG